MKIVRELICCIIVGVAVFMASPFAAGFYYDYCGPRATEQGWLNRAIYDLKIMRFKADPETKAILDYTINRYNRIGGFDVMVMPIPAAGMNCPFCPGITLDPEVLEYPIHEGALILVHEAMHDYYPYFHPWIDSRMRKVGCF